MVFDRLRRAQPAPRPTPSAGLTTAREAEQPSQERRFVNQQLSARRIEDSARESVSCTAPQCPCNTIDAEQMRVSRNELSFRDELRHWWEGRRNSNHG